MVENISPLLSLSLLISAEWIPVFQYLDFSFIDWKRRLQANVTSSARQLNTRCALCGVSGRLLPVRTLGRNRLPHWVDVFHRQRVVFWKVPTVIFWWKIPTLVTKSWKNIYLHRTLTNMWGNRSIQGRGAYFSSSAPAEVTRPKLGPIAIEGVKIMTS